MSSKLWPLAIAGQTSTTDTEVAVAMLNMQIRISDKNHWQVSD